MTSSPSATSSTTTNSAAPNNPSQDHPPTRTHPQAPPPGPDQTVIVGPLQVDRTKYRSLDPEDLPAVLNHYWEQVGLPFDPTDNNVEAAAAINRITGGNFRLIERLMTQIARILDINQLDAITPEVIAAARQMLVVGTSQ